MALLTSVPTLEARTTDLLREVFGPAAYARTVLDTDPETGEPERILELHYAFDGGEGRMDNLLALHQRFFDRWSREIPHELHALASPLILPVEDDRC